MSPRETAERLVDAYADAVVVFEAAPAHSGPEVKHARQACKAARQALLDAIALKDAEIERLKTIEAQANGQNRAANEYLALANGLRFEVARLTQVLDAIAAKDAGASRRPQLALLGAAARQHHRPHRVPQGLRVPNPHHSRSHACGSGGMGEPVAACVRGRPMNVPVPTWNPTLGGYVDMKLARIIFDVNGLTMSLSVLCSPQSLIHRADEYRSIARKLQVAVDGMLENADALERRVR